MFTPRRTNVRQTKSVLNLPSLSRHQVSVRRGEAARPAGKALRKLKIVIRCPRELCAFVLSQQWELRQEDCEFETSFGLHSECKASLGYKIQVEPWGWLSEHLLESRRPVFRPLNSHDADTVLVETTAVQERSRHRGPFQHSGSKGRRVRSSGSSSANRISLETTEHS